MAINFAEIVPYLTHPLSLIGFVVFIFFGVHRALLKAGIVPQLTRRDGNKVVRLLLHYGFIIALVIIVLGFSLQFISNEPSPIGPVTQETEGWCSPAVNNSSGDVSINCEGVNPKIVQRLEELLKHKDVQIYDSQEMINQWVRKYNELREQLEQQPKTDLLASKASKLLSAGELEQAEKLYERSLNVRLATIEEQTISVAADAYNLGSIKELQFDYKAARIYYEQAVSLNSKSSLYNIQAGLINRQLASYTKAISYLEQAMAIDLKTFGEGHPSLAVSRNGLGAVWADLAEYEKAIYYLEQALTIDLKSYGEDDPSVAMVRRNLGGAWFALGQYQKALAYLEQALASDIKTYGEGHPRLAVNHNGLGSIWYAMAKYEKAIDYLEQALTSNIKTYGEDAPSVAMVRRNLGGAWFALGQYQKALAYFEQALASDTKIYGEDHPVVANDLNSIGSAWLNMDGISFGTFFEDLENNKKATSYFEQALVIELKAYGGKHPNVSNLRNKLAVAAMELGEYKKAIGYLELALASDLMTYGEKHPAVANHLNNLGGAWYLVGEYKKANSYFEEALSIYSQRFGDDHIKTQNVKDSLFESKERIKEKLDGSYEDNSDLF